MSNDAAASSSITRTLQNTIIASAVLFPLLWLLTAYRFYCQRHRVRTKATTAGDLFVVLALLTSTAITAFAVRWMVLNVRHAGEPNLSPLGVLAGETASVEQGFVAISFLYVATIWSVKGAFLSVHYEMIRALSPLHTKILHALSAYIVVSYLICTFVNLIACAGRETAMADIFSPNFCAGASFHDGAILTQWLLNITGDILILGLYIFTIRSLSIAGRQLSGFALICLLYSMTITASTLRYIFAKKRNDAPGGEMVTAANEFRYGMWMTVEWMTGYVAVCLPAMRARFREKVHERMIGRRPADGPEASVHDEMDVEDRDPSCGSAALACGRLPSDESKDVPMVFCVEDTAPRES